MAVAISASAIGGATAASVAVWDNIAAAWLGAGQALQLALDQGQVTFLHGVVAQQLMEGPEIAPAPGDEQTAAGIPVKAVDQFEVVTVPPRRPERFNDPEGQAAAPVHGQAGGFVHDQKLVIVELHKIL